MFHDKDYFFCDFILWAQNKSIIMKYSPGCIFTAVVISRWVMHNAERGQFILLLQILQISLKNQPLCKIFANYHQESTTLQKFWKLQWKTNHIAQMWVITNMKDPLYCTILANYDEKSTRMHKSVRGSQRLRGRRWKSPYCQTFLVFPGFTRVSLKLLTNAQGLCFLGICLLLTSLSPLTNKVPPQKGAFD